MTLDSFEETKIQNSNLPQAWQSQSTLLEFEDFLQQNWEQRSVFYEDREIESKQQFLDFVGQQGIRTKKYIGTIVFKGEQLNIYPKMFKSSGDSNDTDNLSQQHLMMNLINWLEYCNRISYPFIHISTEIEDTENLKELFITLYIGYVRTAIERGIYYQYVEETEDINTIKGAFDLKDYAIRKIPNGQANKFRCTYSNFESDNRVNRIIKATCKMLINETSSKNQKSLRQILIKLNEVSDIKCTPHDCDGIRLSKLQSVYKTIISMSKMFLLNRMSNYTVDSQESFCFLFPTDLLFEGFIGGYMQETLLPYGGKVKLQQSDMYLLDDVIYAGKSFGAALTMRHDIVVEIDNNMFILDTKHKEISRFAGDKNEVKKIISKELDQNDVYQICEYARKRNILDIYLLYPLYRFEENEPDFPIGISRGGSGDIRIHFVRLPFVFENDIQHTKEQLKSVILDIFDLK